MSTTKDVTDQDILHARYVAQLSEWNLDASYDLITGAGVIVTGGESLPTDIAREAARGYAEAMVTADMATTELRRCLSRN